MPTKMDARILASVLGGCCLFGCTPQGDPMLESRGFRDDFERSELGPAWRSTGGSYEIRAGRLSVRNARNQPLWLRRRLPRNVRVEFDACSESTAGDIKVELFGDGSSKATSDSYTATSYVVVFGGWGNSLNIIARLDEHGADRAVGTRYPVVPGKVYRMRLERRDSTLSVWADDRLLVKMVDRDPLSGRGHDHFAFNDWEAHVWFDNLKLSEL